MSRINKVNPDHYTMAGRLSPDELARQRRQQGQQQPRGGRGRKGPMPPWMANENATNSVGSEARSAEAPPQRQEAADVSDDNRDDLGAGMPRRQAASKARAGSSRKRKRPAPRQKATGKPAGGVAARGSSPQRASKPGARKAATKGNTAKRRTQKKGGRRT